MSAFSEIRKYRALPTVVVSSGSDLGRMGRWGLGTPMPRADGTRDLKGIRRDTSRWGIGDVSRSGTSDIVSCQIVLVAQWNRKVVA